ncbi:MAG: DUF4406 domain-containing protein [Candidatus Wolfebacteria bacterium]|nr:DUF4406 domain-containing protein [Candidatus Wolfebacteria bacterium]MDP2704058.1 DUF4406 domain-containing protein [bacterium]
MRSLLRDYSDVASTFHDAHAHAVSVFRKFRKEYAYPRLGYVAGPLPSQGSLDAGEPASPAKRGEHHRVHVELAGVLGQQFAFPLCTMQDMFPPQALLRLKDKGFTSKHYADFARNVLQSGYVTDVFMAPGWEESKTARAEHEAAKQFGLNVHYVEFG